MQRIAQVCPAMLMAAVVTMMTPVVSSVHAADNKPTAVAAKEDVVEVEVAGQGISKEAAEKDALRKALEKGGKNEIFSKTKVENFQLIKDTIISRAQGIITDYKVIDGPKQSLGVWKVKIKAKVSKKKLAESWGEVQNVLKQIGRPKIMVKIVEKIDGDPQEQSLLETQIEDKLLNAGFDLVAFKGIAASKAKDIADATVENDVKKLQALAKQFKAHIFISGTSNANQAGMETIHKVPFAFYNCDVQIKTYYTDTGKLLSSKNVPNKRGGARGRKEFSPQAGRMALAFAGKDIANQIYAQLMEQWVTAITGGGELILEVNEIKLAQSIKLKKALAKLKGVENVGYGYTKGLATYRIQAKFSAEALTEMLVEDEFAAFLEVEDVKMNRVQGKGVAK